MAMVKIVSPSGWDFDGPVASLIKIASGGLRGNDRREFIKRASGVENAFLPFLDQVKFAADEEPVHLLALGASEAYGPNRNGDGFKEVNCKKYHDTFVKFARHYRNHKNKDPKISYGHLKLSAYNERMRRVELLVALNKEKSAADRNGGFIADKEMEKLARGEDIPVSMACRVPFDVCSMCGNRARTRDEYCKEASCRGGGCADNLTRMIKVGGDTHILHVDNPDPLWFDISTVFRPADRIAYGNKADYLMKAASDAFDGRYGTDGAKLAADLGVMAPLAVILAQDTMLPGEWTPYLAAQIKLAHGLHAMEQNRDYDVHAETRRAFTADMMPRFTPDAMRALDIWEQPKVEKVAAALGALADQKIIMPLCDFALLTKRASLVEDAAAFLFGAYGRMIADGSLERRVANNKYAPSEKLASFKQRQVAARSVQTHSLQKEAVQHRCQLSAIRGHRLPELKSTFGSEKKASDSPLVEELARDYAIYKLACLHRIAEFDPDFLLTARLSACQNQAI